MNATLTTADTLRQQAISLVVCLLQAKHDAVVDIRFERYLRLLKLVIRAERRRNRRTRAYLAIRAAQG